MEEEWYIQTIDKEGGKEELQHYVDQDGQQLSAFGPCSRINILVGATNSGKSRFMRGLAKNSKYVRFSVLPGTIDPNAALHACELLSRERFGIEIKVNPAGLKYDPDEVRLDSPWLQSQVRSTVREGKPRESGLTQTIFKSIGASLRAEFANTEQGTIPSRRRAELADSAKQLRLALSPEAFSSADREWCSVKTRTLPEGLGERVAPVLEFVEALKGCETAASKAVYIPVLRTAVALGGAGSKDLFGESVTANYGLDKRQGTGIEVFTGNKLYAAISTEKTGDLETCERLREFEGFLGKTFFEGEDIELIARTGDQLQGQHLALNVYGQAQRLFHDIGDGIQAVIILLYKLFTIPPRVATWVFIEEPELGLHPGLQRVFLETLAYNPILQDKRLTVFMSTHSSHLLGMALSELEDVSVFAFQRWTDPERFEIRPVRTRQQHLLNLLGVVNSSVFLANCGIWVEGITDRWYLRAYLSAYLESDDFETEWPGFVPQEDVHYAFFEYAGSNLAHYLFEADADANQDSVEQIRAQFLCNRIFLLADRDEGKEVRHNRLKGCQSESFTYYVTPGIEVENLVGEKELRRVLPQLISDLSEDDVAGVRLKFAEYQQKRMGSYLKETLGDLCPDGMKAKSGTLSTYYKEKLARLLSQNTAWNDMSEHAKDLARTLYGFIHKHNQVAPGAS